MVEPVDDAELDALRQQMQHVLVPPGAAPDSILYNTGIPLPRGSNSSDGKHSSADMYQPTVRCGAWGGCGCVPC